MSKPFLTAEWRKLIIINYEVDPNLLAPYLPFGTELDLYNGKCYLSLVGFMFVNTKVKGFKIPKHVNFEEVNLRLYVKHKMQNGKIRRGVVFIKEIVPKPMVTLVANKLFKEHYQTLAMSHNWNQNDNELEVNYVWYVGNRENSIAVNTESNTQKIKENSAEDFITEHYWGYTKLKNNKTSEYEVNHPSWEVYKVKKAAINVEFELTYGVDFKSLNTQKPISVMLAEGSEITVGNKRIIS